MGQPVLHSLSGQNGEIGMLRDSAKGLDNIVGRLDGFHDEVEAHLAVIQQAVNAILKGVDRSITGQPEAA
ncbi:MAG: hypothetical protein VX181_18995, partial [Pseudomonadota bacterium]|nr:hypothetical protein [Pseudomonadota bacterium]